MERTRLSWSLLNFPIYNPSLDELQGWIFTSVGVGCFSLSFVTARLALRGFDPALIALARGAGAGLVAVACALSGKYSLPKSKQVLQLFMAAAGIVFIFPIFTTVALQSVPASRAATITAILPLCPDLSLASREIHSFSSGAFV